MTDRPDHQHIGNASGSAPSRWAERCLAGCLWVMTIMILALPLAFGGTLPWIIPLAGIVSGFALLILMVCRLAGLIAVPPLRSVKVLIGLMAAFLIWMLLQSFPVDLSAVVHPVWSSLPDAASSRNHVFGPGRGPSISMAPLDSFYGALSFMTYFAVGLTAVLLAASGISVIPQLWLIVIGIAGYALYGLYLVDQPQKIIWGVEITSQANSVTATFVYRNSFADLAIIGLVVGTGLLLRLVSWPDLTHGRWRDAGGRFVKGLAGPLWILLAGLTVIAVALIGSNSRSGILIAGAVLVLLVIALPGPNRNHEDSVISRVGRTGGLTVLKMVGAAGVLMLGLFLFNQVGDDIKWRMKRLSLDRLFDSDGKISEMSEYQKRLDIYALTLQALKDRPLMGHGMQTFPRIYDQYRPASPRFTKRYIRAHSLWLEWLAELGIIAGLAALVAGGLITRNLWRAWHRARNDLDALPPVMVAIGCFGLSVLHGAVDFSIQIAGIGLMLFFLIGLGLGIGLRLEANQHRNIRAKGFQHE